MRQLILMLSLLWLFCDAALAAVNINAAGPEELSTLPGIGPSKAAAIVAYRDTHGPFTRLSELDNVPGIGPATLSNLAALVTLGEAAPRPVSDDDATAPAPQISPQDSSGRIDINTAARDALEALPGIGPTKAAAIVEDRDRNGPFASCADLARINGIGPATISSLRDRCTASQGE